MHLFSLLDYLCRPIYCLDTACICKMKWIVSILEQWFLILCQQIGLPTQKESVCTRTILLDTNYEQIRTNPEHRSKLNQNKD